MLLENIGAKIWYWAIIGTVYIIVLTWQDHRHNKMFVDDRRNFFMMGLTISIISHIKHGFFYVIWVFVTVILFNLYGPRFIKMIGEADINSITWLILGYALVSPYALLVFFLILAAISILYSSLKAYVFKIKRPVPFYIVILLSFVISNMVIGAYNIDFILKHFGG